MKWQSLTICCNEVEWIGPQVRSMAGCFDRIVVVDGAAPGDGHGAGDGKRLTSGSAGSTDGTIGVLRELEGLMPNLRVVYADRPWSGKTAMCQAGMALMEPGWIVQRDVDEFFRIDDFARIQAVLEGSTYTDAEFYAYHFWGDRAHHMRLSREVWGNQIPWRRIFRYEGQPWESHEPPRLRRQFESVLDMDETRAMGCILYHYSYCDLGQLRKKERFYGIDGQLVPTIEQWRRDPHSVPKNADLEIFTGVHPVWLPPVGEPNG